MTTRLVICDRQLAVAESLAFALSARGAEVRVVCDLPAAAAWLDANPADVCIVRLYAPDLDANQAAQLAVLARRIAIVVLADVTNDALRRSVYTAGARGIAEMGRSSRELLELVQRVGAQTATASAREARRGVESTARGATEARRLAALLTPREREVLSAMVCGSDTTTIARTLGISRPTVCSHVQSVLTKLGTHSRLGAVTLAVGSGLISPLTGRWTP